MTALDSFHANKDLIKQISTNYKNDKGFVQWNKAFVENPEYKERLKLKTREDQQSLYNFVNLMKKNGEIENSLYPKTDVVIRSKDIDKRRKKREYQKMYRAKVRGELVENAPPIQTDHIQHSDDDLSFCPKCGMYLKAVIIAMRMLNK